MEDFSRELPDLGGSAVRALPSDLTEREEIDLLCQVETYMNVTDKHSQTHPAAGAEEARIYSLVNSLIAKRFSDIGAAVRGEAVAESEPTGLPPISMSTYGTKTACELEHLRRTQRVGPDNLPRWVDNMKGSDPTIDSLIEYILSARAADAPSEPSDDEIVAIARQAIRDGSAMWDHFTKDDAGKFTVPVLDPKDFMLVRAVLAAVKSRAADALDSQLTMHKDVEWLLECAEMAKRNPELATALRDKGRVASSQPSDGGVRNGCDLKSVHAFLMGESPLEGVQFGDRHPTKAGAHWWRLNLRAALAKG